MPGQENTANVILDYGPGGTKVFRARGLLREGLSRDIDVAMADAFSFDGERCDRIVARVLAQAGVAAGDAAR